MCGAKKWHDVCCCCFNWSCSFSLTTNSLTQWLAICWPIHGLLRCRLRLSRGPQAVNHGESMFQPVLTSVSSSSCLTRTPLALQEATALQQNRCFDLNEQPRGARNLAPLSQLSCVFRYSKDAALTWLLFAADCCCWIWSHGRPSVDEMDLSQQQRKLPEEGLVRILYSSIYINENPHLCEQSFAVQHRLLQVKLCQPPEGPGILKTWTWITNRMVASLIRALQNFKTAIHASQEIMWLLAFPEFIEPSLEVLFQASRRVSTGTPLVLLTSTAPLPVFSSGTEPALKAATCSALMSSPAFKTGKLKEPWQGRQHTPTVFSMSTNRSSNNIKHRPFCWSIFGSPPKKLNQVVLEGVLKD